MPLQIYALGILEIERFGKKLEIEYKKGKKEKPSIAEEDVTFELFQVEEDPELFVIHLETENVKIRIPDIKYSSLEKLKEVIEDVKE